MEEVEKCPICGSPAKLTQDNWPWYVDCKRCGMFHIEEKALNRYYPIKLRTSVQMKKQLAIFTGWIRENRNLTITEEIINDFYSFKLPSLEHRAANLLKSFTDPYDLIGGRNVINFENLNRIINIIELNEQKEYDVNIFAKELKYMAVTWSYDIKELEFIYKDYLMGEKKYLEVIDEDFCKITPTGWAYLESLRQVNPESKKAFVAMWFTPKMEKIYDEFIAKAIEDSGYEPIQIGRKQHNNDVNDEIIGEIRNSKFVVADFTGNRGGVYYEAGFAYGLKIDVIYTCRKDWWDKEITKRVKAELRNNTKEYVKIKEKRKVHFDLNHKSFIIWKDGKDLYDKLLHKINSTITYISAFFCSFSSFLFVVIFSVYFGSLCLSGKSFSTTHSSSVSGTPGNL